VRQIEIVRVDEASHVVVAGSAGLTLLRADDLGGAQITTVPGGVNALGGVDWFDEPRVYAAGPDSISVYTLRRLERRVAPPRSGALSQTGTPTLRTRNFAIQR
jgi:hypothetical protein